MTDSSVTPIFTADSVQIGSVTSSHYRPIVLSPDKITFCDSCFWCYIDLHKNLVKTLQEKKGGVGTDLGPKLCVIPSFYSLLHKMFYIIIIIIADFYCSNYVGHKK